MDKTELQILNTQNQEIFNTLVLNPTKNKLPEYLFVNNFLPFFCGEIDISKEPNFFGTWYSIAGTPYAEVDIIDTTDNVIFTVPSIMDSTIINPNRQNSKISLSEVITLAKLHSNTSPIAGENVLNKGLSKKYSEIQSRSKTFTENQARWISIFNRYNKNKDEKTTTQAIFKNDGDLRDDDFEF